MILPEHSIEADIATLGENDIFEMANLAPAKTGVEGV